MIFTDLPPEYRETWNINDYGSGFEGGWYVSEDFHKIDAKNRETYVINRFVKHYLDLVHLDSNFIQIDGLAKLEFFPKSSNYYRKYIDFNDIANPIDLLPNEIIDCYRQNISIQDLTIRRFELVVTTKIKLLLGEQSSNQLTSFWIEPVVKEDYLDIISPIFIELVIDVQPNEFLSYSVGLGNYTDIWFEVNRICDDLEIKNHLGKPNAQILRDYIVKFTNLDSKNFFTINGDRYDPDDFGYGWYYKDHLDF